MDTRDYDRMLVSWDWKAFVLWVFGFLLLLGSWYILFLYIAAGTEGWLAPWDTYEHPPIGTLARSINDFFETFPGSLFPGVLVILVSVLLFIRTMATSQKKFKVPFVFAISNLLFVAVDVVFVVNVAHRLPDLWLPQPRPMIDVGYHRTWPAIVTTILLLFVLCRLQVRASFGERFNQEMSED